MKIYALDFLHHQTIHRAKKRQRTSISETSVLTLSKDLASEKLTTARVRSSEKFVMAAKTSKSTVWKNVKRDTNKKRAQTRV
jgi:hypothetical protein